MKKLLTLTVILHFLMFSSVSFGEWIEFLHDEEDGSITYLDYERKRIHNGYIHIWMKVDYLEPRPSGTLSLEVYEQIDCNEFKVKDLQLYAHAQGEVRNVPVSGSWVYPKPSSLLEIIVQDTCNMHKYRTKRLQ